MSVGLIIVTIITVYLALAAASAPKLMRLIYQDKQASLARARTDHEQRLKEWRADKDRTVYNKPIRMFRDDMDYMRDARVEGFWWSLVWPCSLAFHALSATAFADEIAAERAATNTRIIADYERLLAETFDKELASAGPSEDESRITLYRNLIRTINRKGHL